MILNGGAYNEKYDNGWSRHWKKIVFWNEKQDCSFSFLFSKVKPLSIAKIYFLAKSKNIPDEPQMQLINIPLLLLSSAVKFKKTVAKSVYEKTKPSCFMFLFIF